MPIAMKAVNNIEILTLQDNYIDLAAGDGNEMVQRAVPLKDGEIRNSILAEHGFSALIRVDSEEKTNTILFDFGYSAGGALQNADALNADLASVEAMALSHGHMDHFGGLEPLVERIGKDHIELVLHPNVFKQPRYLKITEDFKINFPKFSREDVEAAGVSITETKTPYLMAGGTILFEGSSPEHRIRKGDARSVLRRKR